jgi:hypothetical protein
MINIIWIVIAVIIIVILIVCVYKRKTAADYYNESNGTADTAALTALEMLTNADNPQDKFTRAQLLRYNIGHDDRFDRERTNDVNDAVTADYFNILDAMGNGLQTTTDPDFILYEIGAFGNTVGNDEVIRMVDDTASVVTLPTITQRRKEAIADAETPIDSVDKYFTSSIKYTDNAQNVHDSGINEDLRKTLARIRMYETTRADPATAIEDAKKYILNKYVNNDTGSTDTSCNNAKAQRALSVINERIVQGGSISTFNDTEDAIFASVWNRTKHFSNANNGDKLRDAVIDALADSHENGSIVCINGRTSRILNSLTTLDNDAIISASAMTKEAYRNQIFSEARDIITREIESASESPDQKLAAVGQHYLSSDDTEIDPATERKFINDVKIEIDQNLIQYNDKFRSEELKKIATECYAGIDF